MQEDNKKLIQLIEDVQRGKQEPIDELKASTLGRYIKKATDDAGESAKNSQNYFDRADFNRSGVGYGVFNKKVYDLEVKGEKAGDRHEKRKKGISTAVDKLVKKDYQESFISQLADALEYLDEEQIDFIADYVIDMLDEEQLNELKASTLGSYIGKAAKQLKQSSVQAGAAGENIRNAKDIEYATKQHKISDKRDRGVQTAAKKIQKGDFQESEEE